MIQCKSFQAADLILFVYLSGH